MKKSHTYYAIRTSVRFVFWSSIVVGLVFTVVKISEISLGLKPPCPSVLNVDFTWESKNPNTKVSDIDLSACEHPHYVVLYSDGTWGWIG
jgi:hypothetical protein